jgi:hypothetical protein
LHSNSSGSKLFEQLAQIQPHKIETLQDRIVLPKGRFFVISVFGSFLRFSKSVKLIIFQTGHCLHTEFRIGVIPLDTFLIGNVGMHDYPCHNNIIQSCCSSSVSIYL